MPEPQRDAVPRSERTFTHTRTLAAPRERVWRALSEPALLARLGHHFTLTITLDAVSADATRVGWRQTFDTAEERARIAAFVAPANEQNLDRLAALVAALA